MSRSIISILALVFVAWSFSCMGPCSSIDCIDSQYTLRIRYLDKNTGVLLFGNDSSNLEFSKVEIQPFNARYPINKSLINREIELRFKGGSEGFVISYPGVFTDVFVTQYTVNNDKCCGVIYNLSFLIVNGDTIERTNQSRRLVEMSLLR